MVNKKVSLMIIGAGVLFSTMLFGCGAKEKVVEESFSIKKVAGFNSGVENKDGGTTEIIKYNKDNNKFYVINGEESKISIVSLDDLKNSDLKEAGAIKIEEIIKIKILNMVILQVLVLIMEEKKLLWQFKKRIMIRKGLF